MTCPKCGQSTLVPQSPGTLTDVHPVPPALGEFKATIEAAGPAGTDSAAAMSALTIPSAASQLPAVATPPAGEIAAFDDIPALIGDAEMAPAPGVAAPAVRPPPPPPVLPPIEPVSDFKFAPESAPAVTRLTQARRGRHPDGSVLLLTRRAVYAQAGLMAGLLVVAFLAGLLVGRGYRPDTPVSTPAKAGEEPVALGGHVLYALSPGDSLPDEGAVVIALPADRKPDIKIAARGLRADQEADLDAQAALGSVGAAAARGDAHGQFQLVVPRPGNYSLLIISSHATRPDGATLPMADGETLSNYFASPAELIGQQRYALFSRRLAGAPSPLTHEFGPTDKR
ncbi:MAG TPA: hypothetical protein VG826_13330 [Pirellulales bacterium]|nr:hypothetical protein [Pirellulales bacterium]